MKIQWPSFLKFGKTLTPADAGEGSDMTDTTTATPPATNGGGITAEQQAAISAAVTAAIGTAFKPVAEAIGELQKGQKALAETAGKAATPEQLSKAVADQIASQNASTQTAVERTNWINEHLKGVPGVYAGALGNDKTKWADEAKGIRDKFRGDLEAAGIKPPAVTSAAPGTTTLPTQVDTSKLKGIQLIELGVKQSVPTPVSASAAPQAAAGGAAK